MQIRNTCNGTILSVSKNIGLFYGASKLLKKLVSVKKIIYKKRFRLVDFQCFIIFYRLFYGIIKFFFIECKLPTFLIFYPLSIIFFYQHLEFTNSYMNLPNFIWATYKFFFQLTNFNLQTHIWGSCQRLFVKKIYQLLWHLQFTNFYLSFYKVIANFSPVK